MDSTRIPGSILLRCLTTSLKLVDGNVLLKENTYDNIIEAFENLGDSDALPTQATINSLEKFVIQLYCGKENATLTNVGSARWHLFSKY